MRLPLLVAAALFAAGCSCPCRSTVAATPLVTSVSADGAPMAVLDNGVVKLDLALPSATSGYYRGPRFDWSGVVVQATWQGHTAFGSLKPGAAPTRHDRGAGPMAEFGIDSVDGYDSTPVGGTFLKIGVGGLTRNSAGNYSFHGGQPVVAPAPITVTGGATWAEFTSSATVGAQAYAYIKRVELLTDKPGFALRHRLTNTGTAPFATDWYSHNMIAFDGGKVDGSYRLDLPFTPTVAAPLPTFTLEGNRMHLTDLISTNNLWTLVEGWPHSAAANQVTVVDETAKVGLRITTDRTPSKWVVYGEATGICPEIFIPVKLAPGETMSWSSEYQFVAP